MNDSGRYQETFQKTWGYQLSNTPGERNSSSFFVVSTHLKNANQMGSYLQVTVFWKEKRNEWNHHHIMGISGAPPQCYPKTTQEIKP